MFAALLIKAEVPILGFSPHLRPIEANFCGWVVVVTHAFVCLWGFTGIIHERFYSLEAIRHRASKKKHKHDLKQRMAKFKRAKKKLMTKVRAGNMFGGGGGGLLGGLGELGAMMGNSNKGSKGLNAQEKKNNRMKKKNDQNKTAEQSMLGSSNNMLLGALMSNDAMENVSLSTRAEQTNQQQNQKNGEDEENLDFAWPGGKQDGPGESGEDETSSDSAVSTPPSSDAEDDNNTETEKELQNSKTLEEGIKSAANNQDVQADAAVKINENENENEKKEEEKKEEEKKEEEKKEEEKKEEEKKEEDAYDAAPTLMTYKDNSEEEEGPNPHALSSETSSSEEDSDDAESVDSDAAAF